MKTLKLSYQKTSNPVNYNQIQEMRSFENFSTEANNSQLMKRLSVCEFAEIIEALENGEDFKISD